jgi:HAD superfamily hydrolase (TIGR01662 family)
MSSPYDVVIPTIGRPGLERLIASLWASQGPLPQRIIVVDDRRGKTSPLVQRDGIEVLRTGGAGPAAARNRGWRAATAPWVTFLDDDVTVDSSWRADLVRDLSASAAASQGRVRVDLPAGRRPTDWERNVKGLDGARWITADFAVKRHVLEQVGGFDERFKRAYREDSDLALRLIGAGYRIDSGMRRVTHEIRSADRWISVRLQAGNADDALMDALHGDHWRSRIGIPSGGYAKYPLIVGSAALAALAGLVWTGATLRFAWRRIAPGPRTPDEILTMLATSAVIPFAAVYHRIAGRRRARGLRGVKRGAVLFDRDGTLIIDVPGLRDPSVVVPAPGAQQALELLRQAGFALGVVSNQDAVARGDISESDLERVNQRVERLLGPFDVWAVCRHGRDARCACRKPEPGLVYEAAGRLGLDAAACVLIGDIGSDLEAARAAGARAILVPNAATKPEEVASAPTVAQDLLRAAELVVQGAI